MLQLSIMLFEAAFKMFFVIIAWFINPQSCMSNPMRDNFDYYSN